MQTIFAWQWIWQIMLFHFAFLCLVLKTSVLIVRMHPLAIMSLVEKSPVLFLTPSTLNHNSRCEVSWQIERQLISSTGWILEIQYLLRWERDTAELVTCSPGCYFCTSLPFLPLQFFSYSPNSFFLKKSHSLLSFTYSLTTVTRVHLLFVISCLCTAQCSSDRTSLTLAVHTGTHVLSRAYEWEKNIHFWENVFSQSLPFYLTLPQHWHR